MRRGLSREVRGLGERRRREDRADAPLAVAADRARDEVEADERRPDRADDRRRPRRGTPRSTCSRTSVRPRVVHDEGRRPARRVRDPEHGARAEQQDRDERRGRAQAHARLDARPARQPRRRKPLTPPASPSRVERRYASSSVGSAGVRPRGPRAAPTYRTWTPSARRTMPETGTAVCTRRDDGRRDDGREDAARRRARGAPPASRSPRAARARASRSSRRRLDVRHDVRREDHDAAVRDLREQVSESHALLGIEADRRLVHDHELRSPRSAWRSRRSGVHKL